jgi:hypothetical protein
MGSDGNDNVQRRTAAYLRWLCSSLTNTAEPPVRFDIEDLASQHWLVESLIRPNALSYAPELRDAAESFHEIINRLRDQPSQARLNVLREQLGIWYGPMVLGNLCSYDYREPRPDRQLEQRLQSVAREVLSWAPQGLVVQILLRIRGFKDAALDDAYDAEALECIAVSEGIDVEEVRKRIYEHIDSHGTIAAFNSHIAKDLFYTKSGLDKQTGWRPKSIPWGTNIDEPSLLQHSVVTVSPVKRLVLPAQVPYGDGSSSKIFFESIGEALGKKNLWMVHAPSGVDLRLPGDRAISSLAHIFLISEFPDGEEPVIPQVFEVIMETMCYRLSSFQGMQRQETQARRLRRVNMMMQQLIKPLQVLSDALDKTQAEVQEIKAILYDPMEAIFALQPRISRYFEQNRVIENPDGSSVRISHQPAHYRNSRENDARWVLAHMLAAVRGKEVIVFSSEEALAREISFYRRAKENSDSSFHHLASVVLGFIGCSCDEPDPIKALENFKYRLFSPFKPGNAQDIIYWDTISALMPVRAKIDGLAPDAVAIPVGTNPFATQAHLLQFISGVVSATFNSERNGCKGFAVSLLDGSCLTRHEKMPWIVGSELEKLYRVLLREIKRLCDGSRSLDENWGDRTVPFVRLLRRLPPECYEGVLKVADDESSFCLSSRECTVVCELKEDGIDMRIGALRLRYGLSFCVTRFVAMT